MSIKVQPSIIDKRFLAGDFKKCCVLNENAKFTSFNKKNNLKLRNSSCKKSQTLQRRRTY